MYTLKTCLVLVILISTSLLCNTSDPYRCTMGADGDWSEVHKYDNMATCKNECLSLCKATLPATITYHCTPDCHCCV